MTDKNIDMFKLVEEVEKQKTLNIDDIFSDLDSVKNEEIKKEEAKPLRDLMFIEDEMIGQKIEPLLTLEANVAKRLVITTYLEGWDLHMTDMLDKASMDIHISFVPLYNYK